MSEPKEKRAGYVSAEQRNKLFTLMQDRPALCSGRFSASFSKKDGQKEWSNIATILNGIPGGKKSWMQWRKTWQDMRSKVKTKQASIKRHAGGTGGGPPLLTKLNQNEENMLSLISNVAVTGHSSVQESVVKFDFDKSQAIPVSSTVDTPKLLNNYPIMEHNYFNDISEDISNYGTVEQTVVLEMLPESPKSTNIQEEKENNPPVLTDAFTATPSTRVKKHTVSSARKLQVAASAAELLSETAKEKLKMKREYYKRKLEIMEDAENRKRSYENRLLEIMEKKIIIEERIACALEKISEMPNAVVI